MKGFAKVTLFGMAALMLYSVLLPRETYACTCVPNPSPQTALAEASAVFLGRVIDIQTLPVIQSFNDTAVTFSVEKSWKGISQSKVNILTSRSTASCGFAFEKDKVYLVYANGNAERGDFGASLCSRTTELATAGEDIHILDLAVSEPTPPPNDDINEPKVIPEPKPPTATNPSISVPTDSEPQNTVASQPYIVLMVLVGAAITLVLAVRAKLKA